MKRHIIIEMGGQKLTLSATFREAEEISDNVGDPIMISREAALEATLMASGLPYSPRWQFTVKNVPQILHIGAKAGGSKLTLDEVKGLVFAAGYPEAKNHAIAYLGLVITPQTEEMKSEGDAPQGE